MHLSVNRMNSRVGRLIEKMKAAAKQSFKMQYKQMETIITGKRSYKSNLTEANEVDYDTAFHEACLHGRIKKVKEMLKIYKDGRGYNALMLAVEGGHQELVRVLIEELHFNVNQTNQGRTPLHEACLQGHTDLVRKLVKKHKANLGAKDNGGNDVLMYAVYGGHNDLVRVLIEDFEFNVNQSRSNQGRTPLHVACLQGHTDLVRELIEKHKADDSAKDKENEDALMYAVRRGHNDLVSVLIKGFHFSVNEGRSEQGRTPLHEACLQGHTDLVRELVCKHGANLSAKDNENEDALMYAVRGGHKYLVGVLIEEFQFNINKSRSNQGRTPLHVACLQGHTDLVRELVKKHKVDHSAKDNDALVYAVRGGHNDLVGVLIKEFHFNVNKSRSNQGRTPLHEACLQGHTDLVRELVYEHKADCSAKDNKNEDALMYAVRGGHKYLVGVLIEEFQFNINESQTNQGRTPLHVACLQGHTDLVRELIEKHKADRNAKDNGGNDVLMYAVRGGHKYLVRVLIEDFHFNVNKSQSNQERTPLHEACLQGHTDLAREIVKKHRANCSAKDNEDEDALMYAVRGGHNDLVGVLIEELQFNVNKSPNNHGRTPLHEACLKGHTDLVRELVKKHKADHSAKDNGGNNVLMYAVYGGHNNLVRVLIKEFHSNVNESQTNQGRTPLHEACLQGHTDLVRELVYEHKADCSAKDNENEDALMYAVYGGHNNLVRVLIEDFQFNVNESQTNQGRTPLHVACLQGHTDLVRELVSKHKADCSAKDKENEDALMYAVYGGHNNLVRVLIEEFQFNVNESQTNQGRTPLHVACLQGHTDLVRELVKKHKADRSAKNKENEDALMYAVYGGHSSLVRVLIEEFQFNVNKSRSNQGRTPLHEACLQGHTDLARELVKEHKADRSAKDKDNEDALMYAVYGGHNSLVRVLIKEFQFNVNKSRSNQGRTPLHEACLQGHTDLVRELVKEHKADRSAKNKDNEDALMYAVYGGHNSLVRVLIKEFQFNVNKSLNNQGRTPLHEACLQGHTDLVRELVKEHKANRSAKDNGGNDALMYAVRGGHNNLVRVLIKEFQFNVNTSQSNQGRTPLHEACLQGHTELVRDLVYDFGADRNAVDADGDNALMYAVTGNIGNVSLLKVLVTELGASLLVEDKNGETPFSIAVSEGQQDIVEFLVSESPNEVEKWLVTYFIVK